LNNPELRAPGALRKTEKGRRNVIAILLFHEEKAFLLQRKNKEDSFPISHLFLFLLRGILFLPHAKEERKEFAALRQRPGAKRRRGRKKQPGPPRGKGDPHTCLRLSSYNLCRAEGEKGPFMGVTKGQSIK